VRSAIAAGAVKDSAGNIEMFLTACAGIAALRSEWTLALRFAGAGESHRKQTGITQDLTDRECHTRAMQPARDALDPAAVEAALDAGRATDVTVALREALAWIEGLPAND
jgi:hypothetical protein